MTGTNDSVVAYIGLGSNIGDREAYLRRALALLNRPSSVEILRCSPVYETEPVGYADQAAFLNMVVAVRTNLKPEPLLEHIQSVEQALGRTRHIRWGPRTIDLDILMYGNERIVMPNLEIPHPRMLERRFVLVPLSDVYEGDLLPGNVSLAERLSKLEGKEGVARWKDICRPDASELSAN